MTLPLDVIRPDERKAAINRAVEDFEHIDVSVNNAGYGIMGAIERIGDADVQHQFETNYFGTLNIIRAARAHLPRQRSGPVMFSTASHESENTF